MDIDVPYLTSTKNLHAILDQVQKAAAPDAFGLDFLKDMGFTSSNDRPIIRVLKYLNMLDSAGRPQAAYREFMDSTQARVVLADRLQSAYDDLFTADTSAHLKDIPALKGWFKTKTGKSESVADKMARTFKSLAEYADFDSARRSTPREPPPAEDEKDRKEAGAETGSFPAASAGLGLTYRIEVNLPDTTNVDTYRAIFRALREELLL